MQRLLVIFCCLIVGLTSCNEQVDEEKTKVKKELKQLVPDYKDASYYESEILKIDNRDDLTEAKSLTYVDNDGTTYNSTALVNNKMQIVKLISKKTKSDGQDIEIHHYFLGVSRLASIKIAQKYTETDCFTTETRTYYNDKGKACFSAVRIGNAKKPYAKNEYKTCDKLDLNPQLAFDIINQEGKFQTNFLGFNEVNDKIYITVGTDFYNASLVIPGYIDLLKTLKNNETKYLNKPLKVEFKEVMEPNGFSYQALLDIKIL